jgi:hypothetical protein
MSYIDGVALSSTHLEYRLLTVTVQGSEEITCA